MCVTQSLSKGKNYITVLSTSMALTGMLPKVIYFLPCKGER